MEGTPVADEGIAYVSTHEFGDEKRSIGVFLRHPFAGFIAKRSLYVGERSEVEAEVSAFTNALRLGSDLGLDRLTVRAASSEFAAAVSLLLRREVDPSAGALRYLGSDFGELREVLRRFAASFPDGMAIERAIAGDSGFCRAVFLAASAVPPPWAGSAEADDPVARSHPNRPPKNWATQRGSE